MSSVTNHIIYQQRVSDAFKKHQLYSDFLQVKNKLSSHGFVCWVAGGAVRDLILQRAVADFDLVTDATTEQILKIFPNAITVGASFGVVKLALDKHDQFFDLATFRRESDYIDGRRPSQIDFATPKEDAFRRDFTMNALFWDDQNQQIVDYTTGLIDIEAKKIVCVGDALVRFQEDHLRIIRLLRFSVQLNFNIDPVTVSAALSKVSLLEKISGERIWAEIQKMLPYCEWNSFFKNELALQIFKFIFQESVKENIRLIHLDAFNKYEKFKFFYVLTKVFTSAEKIKQILKARLKLSLADQQLMADLLFCMNSALTQFEWVYEIEKKPSLADALNFLVLVGDYEKGLLNSIENLIKNTPDKLVDGNDLIGRVPAQQIGDVLKKIRLLQIQQPNLDKISLINASLN